MGSNMNRLTTDVRSVDYSRGGCCGEESEPRCLVCAFASGLTSHRTRPNGLPYIADWARAIEASEVRP